MAPRATRNRVHTRIYCTVYGCLNSTLNKPHLSFFQLPADADRRSKWLHLISREDLSGKPHKCYRLCEDHFDEKYVLPGPVRKKLKNNTLPSRNLPNLQNNDEATEAIAPTSASLSVKAPPGRRPLKLRELLHTSVCCIVHRCSNSNVKTPHLTFFPLPADAERRSVWLCLISREDLSCKPANFYKVCEEHFDEKDILPGLIRKKLNKNALPFRNLHNIQKNDEEREAIDPTSASLSVITSSERKIKSDISECQKSVKFEINDEIVFKNDDDDDDGLQKDNVQKETFHKLCDQFLTKELATLVKAQTDLKFHSTGNRGQQDYITFCINLYNTSPQAYRLLQSTLSLPSPSTLNKHYIPITSEINERIMLALKTKVKSMSEQEKCVSVTVKVMSLKVNLFYDIKADKIIGFRDIDGVQKADPATKALVAIIRGIYNNWKQPIAYALLSECPNYEVIAKWIDKLLEKLLESGLNIRTFVSNMESDFLKVANKRFITIEKPYFFINQRKIYYIFDAPHLIKSVRNNLMLYDFHFNNRVAKYEHILQFYDLDKQKSFKLARILTNSHINPSNFEKREVRYAIQLLSNSVATGLATYIDFKAIDETRRDTVELVKLMNNLFDALNSSNLEDDSEYKSAFCGKESQISFFKEILKFFQCLKLINPKNGRDVTSTVKFIEGFQITMKSILLLFNDLNMEGYNFLYTRRLNLEVIDNLFIQIWTRNELSTDPTSRQFVASFRKLFFSNIIKPPKGGKYNHDLGKVLIQSDRLGVQDNEKTSNEQNEINVLQVTDEEEFNSILILTSDYKEMNMPETASDTFVYVCSYLLRKCGEFHIGCDIFKLYSGYNDYSKEKCSNPLIVPPDDFVNYVIRMEEKLQSTFQIIREHLNFKLSAAIYKKIKDLNLSPLPCPCFPKLYLIKLFIRMRIFYIIKFNNKAFRTCGNKRKYFSSLG